MKPDSTSPAALALAEIEPLAQAANTTPATARALLHAAQILRLLPESAIRRLRQHAGFTTDPDKAHGYQTAAAILLRHQVPQTTPAFKLAA